METIVKLNIKNLDEGPFLVTNKNKQKSEWIAVKDLLPGLAPWGTGKNLDSGMEIIKDDNGKVLLFNDKICWRSADRILVTRKNFIQNCDIKAVVKPACHLRAEKENDCDIEVDDDTETILSLGRNGDNIRTGAPIIGIVFRCKNIRSYYEFGVLNKNKLVLYCRQNDNLYTLCEKDIEEVNGYITLRVKLNLDEIECWCPERNVIFKARDDTYPSGSVGIRSYKKAYLKEFEIHQSQEEAYLDEEIKKMSYDSIKRYTLPEEKLIHVIDLNELQGKIRFKDICEEGRYDMLISRKNSFEAKSHDGCTLWEKHEPMEYLAFSDVFTENGRLIYAMSGIRSYNPQIINGVVLSNHESFSDIVVLEGKTGKEISRRKAPPITGEFDCFSFSLMTGKLSSQEGTDIILRETREDKATAGTRLWAFNKNLNLLWEHDQEGHCWYGHSHAIDMADVNNDGWDEVLAGGFLYDRNGEILWIHDREQEALKWPVGTHYDSATLIKDRDVWRAFLIGSSAGVYIVDIKTGKTLRVHRTGHSQHHFRGCFRDDIPDEQILVSNHHGSNGYVFLLASNGDLLWEAQPDYNCTLAAIPIEWGGEKVIWFNSSEECQCFYDVYGKKIKDLEVIKKVYEENGYMSRNTLASTMMMGNNGKTYLSIQSLKDNKIYLFGF